MQSFQRFFRLSFLLLFFSANAQTVLSRHLEWVKQVRGYAETYPKAVAMDTWGNVINVGVFSTIDHNELLIQVANWPKGIYLLHAQGKVKRIVVQ
jgi:hypothetical protein